MTTSPDPAHTNLDTAAAGVAAEIARSDTKAALLLAFDGAVLVALAGLAGKKLPLPAQIVGAAAALTLVAAAVLLLMVVRPHLGGRTPAPGSFPHWAQLDTDTIRASMDHDTRPARIKKFSVIAVTKYTRLARAVDTILAALVLLLAAAVLAVTG